jgi:ADP-ribose pyrophosphatase YjhB (NUDIX family)
MQAPPGPLRIQPGVAAVLFDEANRVLLHRRRVGGGWAPPSGGLEPGEDVQSGLLRELQEETRLQVRIEGLIGVYSDPDFMVVEYPDGKRVQYVTCLFQCRKAGGELHGSDEGIDWGWFDPRALPEGLAPYAAVWLRDALAHGAGVIVR